MTVASRKNDPDATVYTAVHCYFPPMRTVGLASLLGTRRVQRTRSSLSKLPGASGLHPSSVCVVTDKRSHHMTETLRRWMIPPPPNPSTTTTTQPKLPWVRGRRMFPTQNRGADPGFCNGGGRGALPTRGGGLDVC